MSRVPRKPRSIGRSSGIVTEAVTSRAIIPPAPDPRQPDLFVPGFIPPCKPVLRDRVPVGDRWQYEIKHDGYRLQAHVHDGHVRLYTKGGYDWADRMPAIRDAIGVLGRAAVIDGEAVILDERGASDFFSLHSALANKHAPGALLYAFDLLWLDGEDLRPKPLAERRALLAEILIGTGPAIQLSEHHVGDGPDLLRAACEMGLEGTVAKRRDAPYRSGYVETWIKVKCTTTEHFAVVGFEPEGKRGVASLQIARLDDRKVLIKAGWVGSGISAENSRRLRSALDDKRHVVVEVEHRGATPAGELRHPVFKGWEGAE